VAAAAERKLFTKRSVGVSLSPHVGPFPPNGHLGWGLGSVVSTLLSRVSCMPSPLIVYVEDQVTNADLIWNIVR
jgi:hypothetical protein